MWCVDLQRKASVPSIVLDAQQLTDIRLSDALVRRFRLRTITFPSSYLTLLCYILSMSKGILLTNGIYEGWTYYEYTRSVDQRRAVVLTKAGHPNKCLLLSRYLMENHIGRHLLTGEHVDHINNDRTDDSLGNLQVLSVADNISKSRKLRKWVKLRCPVCDSAFDRVYNSVQCKLPKYAVCCSRDCAARKNGAALDGFSYILDTYYK